VTALCSSGDIYIAWTLLLCWMFIGCDWQQLML